MTSRRSRTGALPKWRLQRAIDYIEANLGERIALADIAAAAGLSRMYFAAQFRAATGHRPHDYLLLQRVERAKSLLAISDLALAEIALITGFHAQSHFTTVFKRLTGETPMKWRQARIKIDSAIPGQALILDEEVTVVTDSKAILIDLAKQFSRTDGLPDASAATAAVQKWLSAAANQMADSPAAGCLITVFDADFNPEEVIGRAHAVLQLIDDELASGRPWIARPGPTIADVALYCYIALAPEGNVDLANYPNVKVWADRIEALPGFAAPQKTPVRAARD